MRGPLNRYRCIDLDWNELKNFSESKIEKPACFITGDLDPVNFFIPDNELFNTIDKHYTDLRVKKLIHKCGHWTQQEKPKEVNEILLDFLKKI
jgi:pimeloyl-ACP methyl ester carboxylesterase